MWLFKLVWSIAFDTENESENIKHLCLLSQILIISEANSTNEIAGIRCILLWLSDISAQSTFESSSEPSV